MPIIPFLTENAQIVVDARKRCLMTNLLFTRNLARLGYFDGNIILNDLKTTGLNMLSHI